MLCGLRKEECYFTQYIRSIQTGIQYLEEPEESYFPNCDDFREWCMERESLIVSQAPEVDDKTKSDSGSLDYEKEADSFYKFESEDSWENYFGATKRINALHNKIYNKPEITSEMDKYIQQQVDNGNYVEINPDEHRDHHQLHFVAYNFVVSNTSTSTKVRMTTDSSMRTESGLSLNDVTQPAPGNVPSLRGILMRSRSHPHYAVYDIKKFFRSVLTTDKDSFLRIVCVPYNSFSSHPAPNPTWRYFRDQAIPFGDSASGDYATCAKVATVQTFIKEAPLL